jgi:uncharacterized oxidoreductase
MVESDRSGHGSHGVIRLARYIHHIVSGDIDPVAVPRVEKEADGAAVLNGTASLGHTAMQFAVELAARKAVTSPTVALLLKNCSHVGRLAPFAEWLATKHLVSLIMASTPGTRFVAPYGGVQRKMGTNPLAIGIPNGEKPYVLDMSTSAVSGGTIRLQHQLGGKLDAPSVMVTHDGKPTDDPAIFFGSPPGAIEPMGGFKGFGLAFMIDILCSIMAGARAIDDHLKAGNNNVSIVVWRPDFFADAHTFTMELERYAREVKSSKVRSGFAEILLPGERARHRRAQWSQTVALPRETYESVCALGKQIGLLPLRYQ